MLKGSAVEQHDKYLGLPTFFYRGIKERAAVEGIVQNGRNLKSGRRKPSGRLNAKTDKEALIKAVVQSLPTYIMSCIKIPQTICEQIESLISKFWWRSRLQEVFLFQSGSPGKAGLEISS